MLTAWAERMKIEMFEEASRCQGTSKLEPRLDVLHGPPGTGKSLVLALMKELFALLEWSMGTQFIYLAFLNSVAAACGGETVHHSSGIPIDAERGSQDMQRFALKLQAMRVVVLD